MFHEFFSLHRATIAILGAGRPCSPIREFTVFLASLIIARSCLGRRTAWSPVKPHGCFHLSQTLLNTTTAFCTALTPSRPGFQITIYRTWLCIASLFHFQWQAIDTSVGVNHNSALNQLCATATRLATFERRPLRNH